VKTTLNISDNLKLIKHIQKNIPKKERRKEPGNTGSMLL